MNDERERDTWLMVLLWMWQFTLSLNEDLQSSSIKFSDVKTGAGGGGVDEKCINLFSLRPWNHYKLFSLSYSRIFQDRFFFFLLRQELEERFYDVKIIELQFKPIF
jgi:hypothetical protein